MKKTFGMLCAAVVCTTGAFAIEETASPIVEQTNKEEAVLGKERVAQIRKEYRDGRYDSFLKEMDESWAQIEIDEFVQLRSGESISPEMIEKMERLQKERYTRVMQVLGNEDTYFAKKVKSALPAERFSGDDLFFKLHQMMPGSGQTQDENTCIDLDVEYDYKATHLASYNLEDVGPLYYALKMEQMDKLSLAAQSFEDGQLKQMIVEMQENFDDRLAQNLDLADLYSLMRGNPPSLESTEGKIIAILQAHQSHLADLEKSEM